MSRRDEILNVMELGEKIGYGNLMAIASTLWAQKESSDGVIRAGHLPTVEPFLTKEGKEAARCELMANLEELNSLGICTEK